MNRPLHNTILITYLVSLGFALTARAIDPVATPPPINITVSDLELHGEIEGENIVFTLTLKADTKTKDALLPLVVGDIGYLDGKFPGKSELVRNGNTYGVRLQPGNKQLVSFTFASRANPEGDWRTTSFAIPQASVRKLSILCDRDDLEVKFPGALNVKSDKTKEGKLQVSGFLGTSDAFTASWKPEVRKLDSELVVACDANTIASASVGVLRLDSIFSYHVIQGKLTQLAIDLPNVNVIQVHGQDIQDWQIDRSDSEHPKLRVSLGRPQDSLYRLRVESEMALPTLPCKFNLPVLTPRDVIRTSGFLLTGADSAVKLHVEKAAGLTQIDQAAFPANPGEEDPSFKRDAPIRNTFAYQYASMPYTLAVEADDIVTSFTADDRLLVSMEDNDVTFTASVQLEIKDAPAREVMIEADSDTTWTVTSISGQYVSEADSDVRPGTTNEPNKRLIYVPFREAVLGTTLVNIRMEKKTKNGDAAFTIPSFRVVNAKSERGYLVAAAEKGIRLKAANSSGLRKVHTASSGIQVTGAQEAWRFKDSDWKTGFAIERAATSQHSEVFHLVSLGEGVMYYSAAITYHISGAPVQEFTIRVPAHIERIEFVGADIEGWTRDGDLCTVKLQTRVMGDYTLLATYDTQSSDGASLLSLGEIQTENTETEVGYIAVASAASLKITEDSTLPDSVIRIDRSEIPVAYSATVNHPILRAYKYVRRPHIASVKIEPYDMERLLGQVVDYVRLSTILSRDGESVTTATYFIKNAERQYLIARLPDGAKLWSISYIHEDGVKESVLSQEDKDHRYLIPVSRPKNPDTAIPVEIVYAQSHGALGFWRSGLKGLSLIAPSLPETHATFASWEVNVPSPFSIGTVGGNVTPADPTAAAGLRGTLRTFVAISRALLDGPHGTQLTDALVTGMQPNRTHHFTRSVNLSSTEPVTVALSIVPDWVGENGSPRILTGAALFTILLLLRARKKASVPLAALCLTFATLAITQAAVGQAILAILLALVIAWAILTILVFNGGLARMAGPVFRLLARPFRRRKHHPIDDDLPFEPIDPPPVSPAESGYASIKILLLLAAITCGSFVARANYINIPPVMDNVSISIDAPGSEKDGEKSATITSVLEFKTRDAVSFTVLPAPSVLTGYELNSKHLDIVSTANGYSLQVQRAGTYKITLHYQAPINQNEGRWAIAVGLPPNTKNKIQLKIPEKGLDVTSDSAVLLKSIETNSITSVDAVFGSTATAQLTWQPRARRTTLEKTLFFSEVNSFVGLQPGVIELTSLIHYQISQGEIRELKVRIPTNVSVTAVSAPALATWSFDPATRLLNAILERPVSQDFTLTLVTQIALEGLPYSAQLQSVEVLDASHQRGSFAIAAPESLQLRIDHTDGLNPMDIQDFPTNVAEAVEHPGTATHPMPIRKAFRYSQPQDVLLTLQAEQVLPEIRVTEAASLSIADERIVLSSQLSLDVAKAGIFSVTLTIPPDFDVETITGKDVSHWDESKEDKGSVTIHLNKQVEGSTIIQLAIARTEKGIEPTMTVPRIVVVDAKKHTGRLTVSSERGVRMMVDSQSGVDIKKASEMGIHQNGILVFDILRPSWAIQLKSEVQDPVLKPHTLQVIDLSEGILQCDTHIHYAIENAGIKALRLKAPAPGVTLSISGTNIASVAQTDATEGIWQVDLHNKVEDSYNLVVSYQMAYDPAEKKVTIAPLLTLDSEEQRGYVVIKSGGQVQVEPTGELVGLKTEDPRTIPNLFSAGDLSSAVYCYRSIRPDYGLTLSVVRHDSAGVLPANINHVLMTSTVSSDGKLLTRSQLDMTVGSLRLLRLSLPNKDDQLWTVLVNGSEVATSRDGDLYCIPLEEQLGSESTHIDLIYAGSPSGGFASRKRYDAPRFDGLPLNDVQWTFYVPPHLKCGSFKGSMTFDDLPDQVGHFDAENYRTLNTMQTEENKKRAEQDLDMGQSLLKAGKPNVAKKVLQEAVNYSWGQSDLNEDARVQLRSLQKQQLKLGLLNRRDAVRMNNNILDDQQVSQVQAYNSGEYSQEFAQQAEGRLTEKDNDAFEALTDKMLDQQAAAAGVISAIRITMPEDGRELHFSRALQIDPNGELFVSFRMASGTWQKTACMLGTCLLCFAGLWILLTIRGHKNQIA